MSLLCRPIRLLVAGGGRATKPTIAVVIGAGGAERAADERDAAGIEDELEVATVKRTREGEATPVAAEQAALVLVIVTDVTAVVGLSPSSRVAVPLCLSLSLSPPGSNIKLLLSNEGNLIQAV